MYVWQLMKMLLALLLLLYSPFTQAQVPIGVSPEEVRAHRNRLDSLRAVTAQKRRETDAYNDAYIRKHPNYLRQHPELVKAHPEYRKKYAKYLVPAKP
jgi:hypothetical protein